MSDELDADQIRAEARGYSEELAEWRRERDALQAEVAKLRQTLTDAAQAMCKFEAQALHLNRTHRNAVLTALMMRAGINKILKALRVDRAMEGAKP